MTRTDPIIAFDWGGDSTYAGAPPGPGVNPDNFSIRWTGQVFAQFTETYTFYTQSDDGVRLYVNNVLIIDNWTDHGSTENSGTIALTAGVKYDIRLEYYERTGRAQIVLSWSSSSVSKQVISQTSLFTALLSSPVNYECVSCQINTTGDSDDVFDNIVSREMVLSLFIPHDDISIDWSTLIASNQDDWKIIVTNDGQFVFHGFVVPDESPTDFQDKPYSLTIRATDGLKLLKQIPLSKPDGTEFSGKSTFIAYLAAILLKTNLALEIRVYCNIYNNAMFTRDSNINLDMMAQCQFDYRTFMTSATDFTDCYDALDILFKDGFKLFYWNGQWVIFRLEEYQYLASPRYYTIYDSTGANPAGAIDPEDYGQIGKAQLIYPVNVNQTIGSRFADKSVKHSYKYRVWDEIPRNNKFERGVLDTSVGDATNRFYTLLDWTYGLMPSPSGLPGMAGTTHKAWRKSIYNAFGIETSRELQLQTGSDGLKGLQSESVPVNAGDKIGISFQIKLTNDIHPGNYPAVVVYIITASTKYFLNEDGSWRNTGGITDITVSYSTDSSQYNSINVDSDPIPADGDLYISFQSNTLAGSDVFFKDFNFTYTPYVAGGYIPVTGDYWQRTQVNNFPDNIDEEIRISDTNKGVFKGAFWSGPGLGTLRTLTPQWYRFGLVENRHYKELINIGAFNLKYRRFWKIEGDFKGTKYAPQNNSIDLKPIGFHRVFRFEDIAGYTKDFMLVTPWRMDMASGIFTGTFIEVKQNNSDGIQDPPAVFNYLFS